jgi:hypothetical protein
MRRLGKEQYGNFVHPGYAASNSRPIRKRRTIVGDPLDPTLMDTVSFIQLAEMEYIVMAVLSKLARCEADAFMG